jgi:acyl-ACP thioesterase
MIEKLIQKKQLKTFQTDKDGLLRPVMLMNELQGIADEHAAILGAGRQFCMDNNIAWVVIHYVVDIRELPNDKEELTFMTWPSTHEAMRATRDFLVLGADGRTMITATSQWVMIDLASRHPVKLADHLPHWECVRDRALDVEFDKLPEFDAVNIVDFDVRYDDVDVNQHINNAVYMTWTTESLGFDWLSTHKLKALKINFRKEIPAGTSKVSVAVQINGNTTRHLIKTGDTVNAIVECEWD